MAIDAAPSGPIHAFDERALLLLSRTERAAGVLMSASGDLSALRALTKTPMGDVYLDAEDCRDLRLAEELVCAVTARMHRRLYHKS